MKNIFLLFAVLMLLNSCDQHNPFDCPTDLMCTEEFRSLTFTASENGTPLVFDNTFVQNVLNAKIYDFHSSSNQLSPGTYIIATDAQLYDVLKTGTVLKFFGVKNNQVVFQKDFIVGHDCCHVKLVQEETIDSFQ